MTESYDIEEWKKPKKMPTFLAWVTGYLCLRWGAQDAVPIGSESVDGYALGVLSRNPQGKRAHNSRERYEPGLCGAVGGLVAAGQPETGRSQRGERVKGEECPPLSWVLLPHPFLPTLLPAVFSLCFLLCHWDISHHMACGFSVLFAVAPLLPSNLFITCGGLGNQIMQLVRAMCVHRLPLSPKLPHKSPSWPLLRATVIFTLAAVYGLSYYCQPYPS